MRLVLHALPLLLATSPLQADDAVELELCFNYGCVATQTVSYSQQHMALLRDGLLQAADAAEERARLAVAVARMYRWAGEQSPIHVDRAGDFLDDGAYGRMDCIDHAHTTERMLERLQQTGALRFHRVSGIERRRSWLIMQHFSATVEETGSGHRWAVDTWFRDHAEPAVVMDIDEWKNGSYPDE